MLKCNSCGAALDLTMAACPACGAEVPMGRLTGLLGLVCRQCDAYNEPGARTCVSCGQPLGSAPDVRPPDLRPPDPRPAAAPAPPPAPAPIPRGQAPIPAGPAAAAPTRQSPAQRPGTGFLEPPLGASMPPAPLPPAAGTAMFTAAAATLSRARLVVERGEAAAGSVFQLGAEEVHAGRSQGAVVFPGDPCLAPHHATFLQRPGQLAVRDEGAAGGLFIRISQGQGVPIRPGGLFAVGDRLIRFAGLLPVPPAPPPDGTLRLGAPRPESSSVLLEEWLEGGVGGRVYLRSGPSITLGRAGCSVNLGDDAYLSQAHAEIVLERDGGALLRDLGSSNGTFLRVPPGGEVDLKDGDELRMGREVLRVELR